MKKLALVGACLALLFLITTMSWADIVPAQVTLGASTSNGFVFNISQTSVSLSLPGTLGGNVLLDPWGITGKYWMWMTGGSPTLTSVGGGNFDVDMGTAKLYLEVRLGPNGDGSMGVFDSMLALTGLHGGDGQTPQFDLTFDCLMADGTFTNLFPMGLPGSGDFTVGLPKGSALLQKSQGYTLLGYLSSGEIVSPTPEPGSLLLMGSGLLGALGVLRRKLF